MNGSGNTVNGFEPANRRDLPTPDSDDLVTLLDLVRATAHKAVRRNRIADYWEDLVQAAMLNFCADRESSAIMADNEGIERQVEKLAAKEARRRSVDLAFRSQQADLFRQQANRNPRAIHRAPTNLLPVTPPKRKGIPVLCLRFVRLAHGTEHEADMARHIRAAVAVVARDTKALLPRQNRAFSLAYVHEKPIDEVAFLLSATPGAATQRLQVIANKLERALVESLAPDLDASSMAILREQSDQAAKTNQKPLSPAWAKACASVLAALECVLAEK